MKEIVNVIVRPDEAIVNGQTAAAGNLTAIYRAIAGDYPKFFKMDSLCKLGFIAAELALKQLSVRQLETTAVILFNRSGSLVTDRNYQHTISAPDNYFPSPSIFVYTLANIVTGEIAIRHKIYGETSFYILDRKDDALMKTIASDAFLTSSPSHILYGWVDYINENDYLADFKLISKL